MANVVIMPKMGQSVESCVITKWEKHVGDKVQKDDILFTYETDKASFEATAGFDGTVLAVFFREQDDVPCLTEIAVIGEPGEDISAFGPKDAEKPEASHPDVKTENDESAKTPAPADKNKGSEPLNSAPVCGVSPRAKVAAKRLGVDLSSVEPTGPHGRIIERDVLLAVRGTFAAQKSGMAIKSEGSGIGGRVTLADLNAPKEEAAGEPEEKRDKAPEKCGWHDEKLPRIRKVIAKSMHDSLSMMAQLTNHASFDATALKAYRKELKASGSEDLSRITYNDFVLYAVSRVLKKYPELNANLLDDTMRYFDHVHLGLPVDTQRGLLVPTIFNADTMSLLQLSKKAKELAAAARSGSINPDMLSGASFTVSNLGPMDIEMFTPIINPPQTGILGVGCMVDRVREADGAITIYPAMGLSLTFDHRAVDGAPAARFLKELKTALEHFPILLAE